MSEIVWQDPPVNPSNDRGKWVRFIAELQEHPGKWAIANEGTVAPNGNGTLQQRLKKGGCEATSRKQPDGTYTLYARWPEDAS